MRFVVIPCSKEKRWETHGAVGPLPARSAYTSPLHAAARAYAERCADEWWILSALHGLLAPDDVVPDSYDVTFSRPDDPVVSEEVLRQQATTLQRASVLVIACPDDYAERLLSALGSRRPAKLELPLQGIALNDLAAMTAALERLTPPTKVTS